MGSMEKAIKTGFICRLCSEMNKVVIHIYSDLGLKLKLAERIHDLLPVTVSLTDPLPKTICWKCISRLHQQYVLVQRIHETRQQLLSRKRLAESLIQTEPTSEAISEEQGTMDPSFSSMVRSMRVRMFRRRVETSTRELRRLR